MSITKKYLELWADSFHEGVWACGHLGRYLEPKGYKISLEYKDGFIPIYTFTNDKVSLVITVYGSYTSWSPLPVEISDTLEWGKPDFMLFDPDSKKILFAVEETAAVPTGNQALQRCERMYGAIRADIPFWYLISEFGQHIDGGVRRDSIWPTIMALKLTRHFKIPCVVLHYSDSDNPEDYESGSGLASLFSCLADLIDNYTAGRAELHDSEEYLIFQYKEMLKFINDHWPNIIDFIPGVKLLINDDVPKYLATNAQGKESKEPAVMSDFLIWPKVSGLPKRVGELQHGKGLIKYDSLCEQFEADLDKHIAYSLSSNTGSRPQPRESIAKWVKQQKQMFMKGGTLKPKAEYGIKFSDFPESKNGNLHVTTAKNIVYIYDRWDDVNSAIVKAYPRLHDRLTGFDSERGTLVYISNSIKPGRLFGDPYTGQIAAFSTIFGKIDADMRYVIAYFPHQSYTQAVVKDNVYRNKGQVLAAELTDILLFAGGVAVKLSSSEVI